MNEREAGDLGVPEQADGAILNHIRRAGFLYGRYAKSLMADGNVRTLVERYGAGIEQTAAAMNGEGIGEACGECARQNPSGCCFSGIEEGYDDILLLLNMLLGCALPESREERGSCFFVGERGCRLRARYYFCLHYFCPALKTSLGERRISVLQKQVGLELHAGWQAEEAVRRWLGAHPDVIGRDESQ
jgi:hypothetical protein